MDILSLFIQNCIVSTHRTSVSLSVYLSLAFYWIFAWNIFLVWVVIPEQSLHHPRPKLKKSTTVDVQVAKGSSFFKSPQATSSSTTNNCLDISPFAWASMPPLHSTLLEKENMDITETLEEIEEQVPRKRKVQQRFSNSLDGKQTFGTKKTGEVKLTTKTSRQVEVRKPNAIWN